MAVFVSLAGETLRLRGWLTDGCIQILLYIIYLIGVLWVETEGRREPYIVEISRSSSRTDSSATR
jgi:hypothetical protein